MVGHTGFLVFARAVERLEHAEDEEIAEEAPDESWEADER